jgi:subtilisin-like proprotein convertase family protein
MGGGAGGDAASGDWTLSVVAVQVPYAEHDFGSFEEHGHKVYWKIDCYDQTMTYGSEDAANPESLSGITPRCGLAA